MSYEKVLQAKKVIIGTKQTAKALRDGNASELIIAADADPNLTQKLVKQAQEANVPVTHVDSAKKLGRACGIEVSAAAVALTR